MTGDFSPVPTAPLRALGAAVEIPQLGFGVWQVPDDQVEAAVAVALDAGYRHIDTARIYGNEEGVGRALRTAYQAGMPSGSVFVTTKVWNDDHRQVRAAFDASMQRLGLDVLDLYLIHWPAPLGDAYVQAWREVLALRAEGRVRAVGAWRGWLLYWGVPARRHVAETNVRLTMENIRRQSPILREMARKGEIAIVGGLHDLETGRVTFLK